jgi:hypothetical protein
LAHTLADEFSYKSRNDIDGNYSLSRQNQLIVRILLGDVVGSERILAAFRNI